jgi:hypothetical protein
VDNRLGLKLCMKLLRDVLSVVEFAGNPKSFAKANEHLRSARQAIAGSIAVNYKGPEFRHALGTGARIPEFVAPDQVSHAHQPTDHFRDRAVRERARRPYSDVVNAYTQMIPQPIQSDATQDGPRRLPCADGIPRVNQFGDGLVKHF